MTGSDDVRSGFWRFWVPGESLPDRVLRYVSLVSLAYAAYRFLLLLFWLFMENVLYVFDTGEKTLWMIEHTNAAADEFGFALLIASIPLVVRAVRNEHSRVFLLIPAVLAGFWLAPGGGRTQAVEVTTWICPDGTTLDSLRDRREDLCSRAPAGTVNWAMGENIPSIHFEATDDPAVSRGTISRRVNVIDIVSTSESRSFATGVIFGDPVRTYVSTATGIVIGRDSNTEGETWFRMGVDLKGDTNRFDIYMVESAFQPAPEVRIAMDLNVCTGNPDAEFDIGKCVPWSWDSWPIVAQYRVYGPRNEHGFAEEVGQVSSPSLVVEGATGTYTSLEGRTYEFYFNKQDPNEPDGQLGTYLVIPSGLEPIPENSILTDHGEYLDTFTIDVQSQSQVQEVTIYLFLKD
jgi:hypothetical protein